MSVESRVQIYLGNGNPFSGTTGLQHMSGLWVSILDAPYIRHMLLGRTDSIYQPDIFHPFTVAEFGRTERKEEDC